ncbi:uncharacterized protein TRAVEDRAFT_142961 [Trametes versicolor FP-101664 SS1]|uniref:uncharacterized protein n=1 Tax=Trametes versicolor (strain FP-101664) TaxID=717944 RepID=UPI000462484C|nr:uncharacterized protein TRAVEDRAFT_142961 [Trametes versicolor FP-101664 SS1]EIW61318.1 hypothetical protein TRAVEDRAFT_142961 [Trametes versicolor FP-101664 SS1]
MFTASLALICLLAGLVSLAHGAVAGSLGVQTSDAYTGGFDDVKVPVVLGVMSRCPDAVLCETVFDHVLQRVADKVDLSLTFIGKINASEPDFGVTCKHGPEECAGNVHELCAIKYAPTQRWWNFVHCLNFKGRTEIGKPETALQCAKTTELDWENSGVGACAGLDGSGKGEEGVRMLQQSVAVTEEMGIEKSCTIVINGKPVCIHDETWKECEGGHAPKDFIRQIEEEYNKLNQS